MNINLQNNLNTQYKKKVKNIYIYLKLYKTAKLLLFISYLIILFVFIYKFKLFFFNNKINLSLNDMFYFSKFFLIIFAAIFITSQLSKYSEKIYTENLTSFIKKLPSKICTCKDSCTCREDLIKELKSKD